MGRLEGTWRSYRYQIPLVLLVTIGQLVAIVTVRGEHRLWSVLLPWCISLVAAIVLAAEGSGPSLRARLKIPPADLVIASALTVLAGLLRLPNLERLPSGIHGDEGEFAAAGLAIAQGQGPPPFGVAFLGDPAAYPQLLAFSIDWLGPGMDAARLPSALVGTATVPVLYALVRSFAGRSPATIAAVLLATSAVHIHFSRLAINVIEVPFFACLCMWFVMRGLDQRRDIWYLLAGITAGLGIYFHFGGRLIGLILVLVLVVQLVADRPRYKHGLRALGLAALGGFLAISPLLAHLSSRPELLTGHVASRGIWNHWDGLAEQFGTEPSNKAGIIWEQVVRTLSAFATQPDPPVGAQFYTFMDAPLLQPVVAVFAILGLAILCRRLRTVPARVLLIWCVVPLLFASVLTDTAGQAHRLIHPLVPALAVSALGIDCAGRYVRERLPGRVGQTVAAALVLVPIVAGVWDGSRYFQPWVTDRIAPAHTAQARCLEALPIDSIAVVAGAPRIAADHGPSRYLGHAIDRRDLSDASQDQLAYRRDTPVFILVHEWQRERLTELRALYPGITAVEIERPPGQRVLSVVALPIDGWDTTSLLRACAANAASN